MKILENHILTFTSGSANNNTKAGGYGYVVKNYNVSELIPRSAKTKTTHQKMEIQALIEVFQKIEPRDKPVLLFVTSDYVYNCLKGNFRKQANKDKWKVLDSLLSEFEDKGGSFKIYLIKSKLRTTDENAKKALKYFKNENDVSDIEYLKKHKKNSMNNLFKEILRCFMYAHDDAVVGMKNCKI